MLHSPKQLHQTDEKNKINIASVYSPEADLQDRQKQIKSAYSPKTGIRQTDW